MLQARQKLWDVTQGWTEDLEQVNAQLRQLVCQRYRIVDGVQLQAEAEALQEGQVVLPHQDKAFAEKYKEVRDRALGLVTHFMKGERVPLGGASVGAGSCFIPGRHLLEVVLSGTRCSLQDRLGHPTHQTVCATLLGLQLRV